MDINHFQLSNQQTPSSYNELNVSKLMVTSSVWSQKGINSVLNSMS